MMTKDVAQMRLTKKMKDAEAALDAALLSQSELFGTMIVSRRDTNSDPLTGHQALLRLVKAQQALLAAGGDLARVHGGLLELARETGILEKCPGDGPMNAGEIVQAA